MITATDSTKSTKKPPWLKNARKILHYSALMSFALAALFLIGFAFFTDSISRLEPPASFPQVDGIIVLTGGSQRINAAMELLEAGYGKRLLISGVNPATSRSTLREAIGARRALFNCCVDIDIEAQDTIGNASQSAKWLQRNGYQSIILVTNNYHIPRSVMELKRTTDDIEITPWPVVNTPMDDGSWMKKPGALRVVFTEYTKFLAAAARGIIPEDIRREDTSSASAH